MNSYVCKFCQHQPIFLEDSCWDHLNPTKREAYPQKLLSAVSTQRRLSGQNFYRVDISHVVFPEGMEMQDCDFTEAVLTCVSLRRANLKGSTFDGAKLEEAHLEYADLQGCSFKLTLLCDAHLEHADLRGLDTSLEEADLRGAHLDSAQIWNANLTKAKLNDAILLGTDLIGAMLLDTHLYPARFMGTRLRKESFCNFRGIPPRLIRVREEQEKNYLLARSVYATLKNNFRSVGENDDERWAYLKECSMERKRLFRLAFLGDRKADSIAIERYDKEAEEWLFESRLRAAFHYIWSVISNLICGYGERPSYVLFWSMIIILGFAIGYLAEGMDYASAFYISTVSFTTLGFVPTNVDFSNKLIGLDAKIVLYLVSGESLLGAFMIALFVSLFVRRVVRG
jgi:uncharacterized protein YjbI with pentapeptide repeats